MPSPVVTYVARRDWVANPNITGVAIGAPTADRLVVLAAGLRRTAIPSRIFTSFKVNGQTATIVGQVGSSNTNVNACIAVVQLPTGTSIDIEITANGVYSEGSLDIYTVTGVPPAPYDVGTDSIDSNTLNATAMTDVPLDGCAIAVASLTLPATDPIFWTGLANEGSDAQNGASFRLTSAWETGFVAPGVRGIAVTAPATREAIVAVSFGHGTAPGGGVSISANQTLSLPSQAATFSRPRSLTYGRTLRLPYQSSTLYNAVPRVRREPPNELVFNAVPVPTGTLAGNTVTIGVLKDIAEQLIGVRGNPEKKAVLREDLTSPEFIAQYGTPKGALVLIPVSMALPADWVETSYSSPIAGMRYIQKT